MQRKTAECGGRRRKPAEGGGRGERRGNAGKTVYVGGTRGEGVIRRGKA